jgi:ribosomal protein S18 acetylase RimI-like enzyme
MVEIRTLQHTDIQTIAAAFAKLGWQKPAQQYEGYLNEQESGERLVLIATVDDIFAGYLTIVWQSSYPPFDEKRIPEIVDFNVLPKFRRRGVGSQLMEAAENQIARRSSTAGIGVGLSRDYGAAQILYVKRGYIPDGRGIFWKGSTCQHGDPVTVDDSLTLYFTKKLEKSA